MLGGRPVDLVVSDMAPNLSGIESGRGAHRPPGGTGHRVFQAHLKPDGALVCKVFHGSGYNQLVKLFKEHLPGGQADQAQGLARQVGGNLSGRAWA
jgi:23S rRNA (uridine2552-2'-O)-methyltransferase